MAQNYTIIILIVTVCVSSSMSESKSNFLTKRKQFLVLESLQFLGSNLKLTSDEMKVNTKLMQMKASEINTSIANNEFIPSIHFFHSKPLMEKSDVFWFLRKMPKGSALHLHDSSMVDAWWLVKQATYAYLDKLYMCTDDKLKQHFLYADSKPRATYRGQQPAACSWRLVADERSRYGADVLDDWIHKNLTLTVDDPWTAYPTQDIVWQRFYSLFDVADGLIFFADVFKAYFFEAITEFYADNVQYLEFRALLPPVYELDGSTHNESWLMDTYINISTHFSKSYPDFVGAKVIYSSSRSQQQPDIQKELLKAVDLRQMYSDYLLGYDLVGQEDAGHTLEYNLDTLLLPSQNGYDLPYFFHAGETNWEGRDVDENLIDALLLNTTRIGHGYAITKHPQVMQMARRMGVAIEVCPISNQVLKLVEDLRNHPVTGLIAQSYPLVISADDPGLWGARGLTHDFYEAFMGLGGAKADLRFLKQLAINSIQYSALKKKNPLYTLWQKKWAQFIQDMKAYYRL